MYKLIGSIVIYNTKFEEIRPLLEEFYKQNINQKLVIIDNSNTGYLKDDIFLLNNDIDYIISENIGYGRANNIAAQKYEGLAEYFLIMNPDIFINFEDLEEIINYAERKKEFGIIMPKIIYPDGENQYSCKLLPKPQNLFFRRFFRKFSFTKKLDYDYEFKFFDYNTEIEVPVFSGCFLFCKYRNLIEAKMFDERYFMYLEDVDLSRRMFKYGNYFFPEVKIIHNFNKSSFKSFKMTLKHIESAVKYFNKWGWFSDEERKKINHEILIKYKKGRV